MNKIKIEDIIYYGRFYDGEQWWYMDLKELKIYNRDELLQSFGLTGDILSDSCGLMNDYHFAELFRVDIIDEERDFLNGLNNRYISREIKCLDREQLPLYFNKYMELHEGDARRWGEHERQLLTVAAVEWCRELHIPYVM